MTRGEARRLRRYICGLCEQTLYCIAKNGCHALFEKCSPEVIAKRQADCLSHYKPRRITNE